MKNNLKCCVKGCERPVKVVKHMLCSAHTQRLYREGNPGNAKINHRTAHPAYATKEKRA